MVWQRHAICDSFCGITIHMHSHVGVIYAQGRRYIELLMAMLWVFCVILIISSVKSKLIFPLDATCDCYPLHILVHNQIFFMYFTKVFLNSQMHEHGCR